MRKIIILLSPLLLVGLLISCKPNRPDGILSERKMENVLYDYHIAKALAQRSGDSIEHRLSLYTQAVFQKHRVSEAVFDSSLRYYTRHADVFYNIYERLNNRFVEAGALAASSLSSQKSSMDNSYSLWQGRPFNLLSSNGTNRLQFEVSCDTILQEGDNLQLRFSNQWLYKEGQKMATVVLAVCYEGDSVVSTSRTIYGSGDQTLSLRISEQKPTAVYGFIYQNVPWSREAKLLTISYPELVRNRFEKKSYSQPAPAEKPKADTVRKQRPQIITGGIKKK